MDVIFRYKEATLNKTAKNMAKRGRPAKVKEMVNKSLGEIKIFTGNDLNFKNDLFKVHKTETHLDCILSSEGGIMPGTNICLSGGPGSGKTTLCLDLLSNLEMQGKKCLFVSGEMGRIAYFKYCKRNPKFNHVHTLFLKEYMEDVKPVLEKVFAEGYDVVVVDSMAEVFGAFTDEYGGTSKTAEKWFLKLQDQHKEGNNKAKKYTSFINIQQQTKGGNFAGSNRLSHMHEAMCNISKSKNGVDRKVTFSKNRDGGQEQAVYFQIGSMGVNYSFEKTDSNDED